MTDFSSRAIPSLGVASGTDPRELDVLAPGVSDNCPTLTLSFTRTAAAALDTTGAGTRSGWGLTNPREMMTAVSRQSGLVSSTSSISPIR